jgi:predicted P-loop ATPase
MDRCRTGEAVRRLAKQYGAQNGHQPERLPKHQQPQEPEVPVPAETVRAQLRRQGWEVAAEFQYSPDLRKVLFHHQDRKQPDKNRPEKTFRWEHRRCDRWYARDGGKPKPIYLNAVFRERDQLGTVLGVEGEAKADFAGNFGYPAFSFREEISAEDAKTLNDLDVVLWADHDDPGQKYMEGAANTISQHGQPRTLSVIQPPAGLPPGGDIVDAVQTLGWSRKHVEDAISSAAVYQTIGPNQVGTINAEDSSQQRSETWQQDLIHNRDGNPKPILANAITALRNCPTWSGVLSFNDFSLGIVILKSPPWPTSEVGKEWTDHEDRLTANWLQHAGIFVGVEVAGQAVQAVAKDRRFHPVREYLDSLNWDGTRRIDNWLSHYLAAEQSNYTSAVGARWLISAVARIYRPGCKADCCLILEGPQGLLKSTAIKTIAGEWFTDEIADLGGKDAAMQTRGVWVIEIAELDSMSRGDVSKIKAFMSRATDRFRPPYGKRLIESPRQCVFAGSVNKSEYLRDETGGRRFWPVPCTRIRIDSLSRDRDQLWAEAVRRYQQGTPWWLDSPELNTVAQEEQADRYEQDAWQGIIRAWVAQPKQRTDGQGHPLEPFTSTEESVTSEDVLLHAIGKRQEFWTPQDAARVKRCLEALGWRRRRLGPRNARSYRFQRVVS